MNLLFDLDGTLTNSFSAFKNSIYHAFNAYQIELPSDEVLRKCIGPPLRHSLEKILNVPPSFLDKVHEAYRKYQDSDAIFQYEFFPEAVPLLIEARVRHKIYLATSKPRVLTMRLLSQHSFDQYFEKIFGSQADGTHAEKEDLIRHIMQEEKLNPAETVMIGDREFDVMGAHANKIRSIGVTWGYGSLPELQQAGADLIFKQWSELANWVRGPQEEMPQ